MKKFSQLVLVIACFAFLLTGAAFATYWIHFRDADLSADPEQWGQFGDYLGGVLNPLLSLAALIALLVSLRLQFQELTLTSEQAARGAKSASEAARISYLTQIASNRAHIVFNGMRWRSHPIDGEEKVFWRVYACWVNKGNTPAMNCRLTVRWKFSETPIVRPEDLDWTLDQNEVSRSVSPGSELLRQAGNVMGSKLQEVKDGKCSLYVWGWCDYADIYPDTPPRRTQFALRSTEITGDPNKVWDSALPVDLCLAHFGSANLVDEDCQRFLAEISVQPR